MAKKPAKSETMTIRMDPKTRFMLDFISKLRGQTITTVVDRAIYDAANNAQIGPRHGYVAQDDSNLNTWQDFWSIVEGERELKLASEPTLFPTYEEERRLAFCRMHWPFFWDKEDRLEFRSDFVEVLWPRINEFVELFHETKTKDYQQTGREMVAAVKEAGLEPPQWPPLPTLDIDSEVPF